MLSIRCKSTYGPMCFWTALTGLGHKPNKAITLSSLFVSVSVKWVL